MTTDIALVPEALLTTTRTVRRRLDLGRDVPLSEIDTCLAMAAQAPCGSRPAHWLVITDPAIRAAIAGYYRSAFTVKHRGSPPSRSLESAAYLAENLARVPVLVLACVDTGGPLPPGNQASLWGGLLPSVWSYMLAARSRGLGTAWTTAHLAHEREIADLLGLPAGVHQGALIPTAYYLGTSFRPAARPTPAVHRDRW
ncbi:nitroreductase family protein [Actinokineospora fastidiosa]|uniref:Oxidoreductase n=1 Tax=Actinokineospora fastidiosa TaxID=1816 RepID=A0A918GJG2_9PSEU|nr:nitroreductase family protein [Actinokineospora fastidiosa]GGS36668.1 oxidoreductase [Actinokineospora fastidiosa]